MSKRASELVSEGAASKPKKTIGKMKVQGTKINIFFPFAYPICPLFFVYYS
jgi:hypothetical protein